MSTNQGSQSGVWDRRVSTQSAHAFVVSLSDSLPYHSLHFGLLFFAVLFPPSIDYICNGARRDPHGRESRKEMRVSGGAIYCENIIKRFSCAETLRADDDDVDVAVSQNQRLYQRRTLSKQASVEIIMFVCPCAHACAHRCALNARPNNHIRQFKQCAHGPSSRIHIVYTHAEFLRWVLARI